MKNAQISETFTNDISSLSHEGRGITHINGKTAFVSGALANEKVICKVTKRHSRYYEAEVVEVIHPAPERASPQCAHFSICGGCSLQHMEMHAQVQFKQQVLLEQLKHFGKVTPENILPPLTGSPYGYRRKARLGVRYVRKKERLMIGFREKFSNYLTDVRNCSVLHPHVGTKLEELSTLIASLTQFEYIPQIEVAVSDHETALVFRHLTPLPEEDIAKLCAFAETHAMHFYLQPNPPEKIRKIWPHDHSEKLTYLLNDFQLKMEFEPLDFVQINGEINQQLLKQALHLLDPQATDSILDLFCGLGNFTLPIARSTQHVIGVEGSQDMVLRASENALKNNIKNTTFYASNLMEPSPTSPWLKQSYDKILLDPPRAGAKEIIAHFQQLGAKRIVYVSCNPATLARDAYELVYTHQYKLKQLGVVNMFPHTSHIEAIALFEK